MVMHLGLCELANNWLFYRYCVYKRTAFLVSPCLGLSVICVHMLSSVLSEAGRSLLLILFLIALQKMCPVIIEIF